MSTLREDLEDLVNRWAVGGNGIDAASRDLISACSAELLRVLDAHPDEPGSEPEPAKVIVVTEMPSQPQVPRERRYAADGWTITDGTLFVNREGKAVAVHAHGTWLSVREDGAEVPDATARALDIAKQALSEIVRRSEDGGDLPFGRIEIGGIAATALNSIWNGTEG